ncbi:transposase [Streptomyces sp. NPDC058682]|uniref:IS110 family transposase n=1 Tax=Streptomyces sp. NPDC058682 TaxID=3346596 RepID=UPI00366A44B2
MKRPTSTESLLEWLRSHGDVLAVGVEGTGAYGSELARFLWANAVTVVDVDRPDRKAHRTNGKSDPVDAYAAATASCPAVRTADSSPATASSRPSGPCEWSAARPSSPARRP